MLGIASGPLRPITVVGTDVVGGRHPPAVLLVVGEPVSVGVRGGARVGRAAERFDGFA